jgi:hypothetical protein
MAELEITSDTHYMSNPFLTKALAEKALDLIAPSIELAMETKLASRNALHIVVMNYRSETINTSPSESFERSILAERSINRDSWPADRPLDQFARAKTEVTWRTGHASYYIREFMPWAFKGGDFKYGGAVNIGGIVVGASGMQWQLDQCFAEMVASAIKMLVLLEASKAYEDKAAFFLPASVPAS